MINPKITTPFEIGKVCIKNHELFDDVTLEFSTSGINLIVGENGSGKSTLLDLLSFHFDTHVPITNYLVKSNLEVIFELVSNRKKITFTLYKEHTQNYPNIDHTIYQNIRQIRPIINHDDTNSIGMKSHENFKNEIAQKLLDKDDLLPKINKILKDNEIDLFLDIEENKKVGKKELNYGSIRNLYKGLFRKNSGNLSSGEYYLLKLLLESLGEFKILLIEEPEISLHPEWQAKIIGILRHSLIGEKQIFIVTQSPYVFSENLGDTNVKLFTLQRGEKKSSINSIESLSNNWQKSFNGINYFIFNIINNEYHIELFNAISIEVKNKSIKKLDKFIKNRPEYIKEEHEKTSSYKKIKYETIPVYIRNVIHHPNNGNTFDEQELRTSIKFMLRILNKIKHND